MNTECYVDGTLIYNLKLQMFTEITLLKLLNARAHLKTWTLRAKKESGFPMVSHLGNGK